MVSDHPGQIVFVDGDTHELLRRVSASDLPVAATFVDTAQGRFPVVRVEHFERGSRRLVHEYGPAGELLRTRLERHGPS